MSYTHSNAGNINSFGTNQVFKQWRLVGLCVLSLLGLTAINSVQAADGCDSFLSCCDTGGNCRQFYLGGIVGADFGTFTKVPGNATAVPNQSLFTGGGTVGMRSLRDNGAWRLEFEGRGRDQITATSEQGGASATTAARDGWSTMVNVWRDYEVVGDFDVYAGGGIGAGGYRSVINAGFTGVPPIITSNDNVSEFAWQAGGGLIYQLNDQVTFDVGYRFYQLNDSLISEGYYRSLTAGYSASQVMFSLRMFEPLRSLLR